MALQFFDTVTSTMDVARDNLISGRLRYDQMGRLPYQGVIANEQTAGRGQRGREWYAPYGESLCATYYFRRGLISPQTAGRISLLAGVAVADTLHRVCLGGAGIQVRGKRAEQAVPAANSSFMLHSPFSPPPRVGLKWPNDLLLNGKKAGGILVELVQVPATGWVALIGVGLNVHVRDFPAEMSGEATSLQLEDVPIGSITQLSERIAGSLDALADRLNTAGFDAILRRWRVYDETPGRYYQTELEGTVVAGVAEGIDTTGALQLRLDDRTLHTVMSASSVREIRPPGK